MFEDVDMDDFPGLGGAYDPPAPSNESVDQVTVHHFSRGPMPLSSSAYLDMGRIIARSVASQTGWHNVRTAAPTLSFVQHRIYLYRPKPPMIIPGPRTEVREWGSSVTEDEAVFMADLEEFKVTDLVFLAWKPERSPSIFDDSLSDAELYATAPVPLQPPKLKPIVRPPRDLDRSPLHTVIPEPHFLPPLALHSSSVIQDRIPPYNKTNSIPIPLHTITSVRKHLVTPYSRGSWIIPIRGTPPWEGCSPAVLSTQTIQRPSSPDNSSFDLSSFDYLPEITWTHELLLTFWNFLLNTRKAGRLGHISLSFHAAPVVSPPSPVINTSFSFTGQGGELPATYPSTARSEGLYEERGGLPTIDHFKIYCDVEFAMYMRSALDAWFVDCEQAIVKEEVSRPKRLRPLEGSRIAFVDERGRGVFIA